MALGIKAFMKINYFRGVFLTNCFRLLRLIKTVKEPSVMIFYSLTPLIALNLEFAM